MSPPFRHGSACRCFEVETTNGTGHYRRGGRDHERFRVTAASGTLAIANAQAVDDCVDDVYGNGGAYGVWQDAFDAEEHTYDLARLAAKETRDKNIAALDAALEAALADTHADALEQLALDHVTPWSTRAAADARAESNRIASEQTAQTTYDNAVFTARADFQDTADSADQTRSGGQTDVLCELKGAGSGAGVVKATEQAADDNTAAAAGASSAAQPKKETPPAKPEDVTKAFGTGESGGSSGGFATPELIEPSDTFGELVLSDERLWTEAILCSRGGRTALTTDLDAGKARDVEIAGWVTEIVAEMEDEGWVPDNPEDDGAYGKEFEKRLFERISEHSEGGTNRFYTDVCVDTRTRKVVKIGNGPGPKGTTQIDVLYYRGELRKGDKLNKTRVIDVYDAKVGDIDVRQMRRIRAVTGKTVKVIESPRKWTRQFGWHDVPGVQAKLKFLTRLGAAFTVYALVTTDVEAEEVRTLMVERQKAGNDLTEIIVWANTDLQLFLRDKIPDENVCALVVLYVIECETKRFEEGL